MLNRKIVVSILTLTVVLATVVALARRSTQSPTPFAGAGRPDTSENTERPAKVQGGGTSGPAQLDAGARQSIKTKDGAAADDAKSKDNKSDPFDPGKFVPVRADLNPDVASVHDAIVTKAYPERLSPLIQPKPFNAESYKQNPKAYLQTIEPGRVFQSLQPDKDVARIRPLSPQMQEIAQGESVTLKVQCVPSAPVTFSSFDGGAFQNQLNSITVATNESGVAEVKFFGTSGTINTVNILAASPMASGQVKYVVYVTKK